MNERIVSFGQFDQLNGVVGLPDQNRDGLGVIILNAGLMHRTGPCRISVDMARTFAAQGLPVLRFDFSGIGYSVQSSDSIDVETRNVKEVITALDYMSTQYHCHRFVVYGLCSGARNAFQAALLDDRIIGLVQIDSYSYRNVKHFFNHYLPRAKQLMVWKSCFTRTIHSLLGVSSKSSVPDNKAMALNLWTDYPPRKEIERFHKTLVDRGVQFFVVYTGSWKDEYNYREQFFDIYAQVNFAGQVALHFQPEANHIMTHPQHRQWLISEVVQWINTKFDDTTD